jgi:hypothetical protein
MELDEAKGKITALEDGDAIWEAVSGAIENEKEVGRKSRNKANDEAKGLREQRNKLREGLKTLEIDYESESWIDDLRSMKTKAKSGSKASEENSENLKVIEKLQNQIDEITKDRDAVRSRERNTRITNELSSAFGEKIYSKDLTIKGLISDNAVSIDDETDKVYINIEGENYEPSKGVEKLLELKRVDGKVTQKPGSEGSGSGTDSGTKSEEAMRAEMASWNKTTTGPLHRK